MKTIIPDPPATPPVTSTCPDWCRTEHTHDDIGYSRAHFGTQRKVLTSAEEFGPAVKAFASWYERSLSAGVPGEGKAPRVLFGGALGNLASLSPSDAVAVADAMDLLGRGEVAEILRAAVADLSGGAA